MKGHVSAERLMELALDRTGLPRNGEAEHLEECESCAAQLRAERELTQAIFQVASDRVPENFTYDTVSRFRDETRRRTTRQLLAGAIVLSVVAAPIVVLLVIGWRDVLGSVGSFAVQAVAVAGALSTAASSAPFVALALLALICLTGVVGFSALARLSRNADSAKYFLHRDVPPGGDAG